MKLYIFNFAVIFSLLCFSNLFFSDAANAVTADETPPWVVILNSCFASCQKDADMCYALVNSGYFGYTDEMCGNEYQACADQCNKEAIFKS